MSDSEMYEGIEILRKTTELCGQLELEMLTKKSGDLSTEQLVIVNEVRSNVKKLLQMDMLPGGSDILNDDDSIFFKNILEYINKLSRQA